MGKKIFLFFSCLSLINGWIYSQSSGWSIVDPLPIANTLHCIKFFNENIGYAVGDNGTILNTLDKGL